MNFRNSYRPILKTIILAALLILRGMATEVSVLGYHDFTENESATEMRIPLSKFRQQMQILKDSKIEVISMADFLAWKRGEKTLPEQAVLITIDDGWKSVYTQAYPVLKKHNFPFTVFLYTNYIDVGGRSMTIEMITEMIDNGCSIGCHSVSHPFPRKVKREKRKGKRSFEKWLDKEIGKSFKQLKEKFGENALVPAYAYPGGFHTPEMYEVGAKHNYQAMFTVQPKMVTADSSDFELPRFIVLGTHDYTFTNALKFSSGAFDPRAPVSFPGPDAHITDRNPTFKVQFPKQVKVAQDTIRLSLTEIGEIALDWITEKNLATGKPSQPLRSSSYEVELSYREKSSDKLKTINWTFYVDRELSYATDPDTPTELPEPEHKPLQEK